MKYGRGRPGTAAIAQVRQLAIEYRFFQAKTLVRLLSGMGSCTRGSFAAALHGSSPPALLEFLPTVLLSISRLYFTLNS